MKKVVLLSGVLAAGLAAAPTAAHAASPIAPGVDEVNAVNSTQDRRNVKTLVETQVNALVQDIDNVLNNQYVGLVEEADLDKLKTLKTQLNAFKDAFSDADWVNAGSEYTATRYFFDDNGNYRNGQDWLADNRLSQLANTAYAAFFNTSSRNSVGTVVNALTGNGTQSATSQVNAAVKKAKDEIDTKLDDVLAGLTLYSDLFKGSAYVNLNYEYQQMVASVPYKAEVNGGEDKGVKAAVDAVGEALKVFDLFNLSSSGALIGTASDIASLKIKDAASANAIMAAIATKTKAGGAVTANMTVEEAGAIIAANLHGAQMAAAYQTINNALYDEFTKETMSAEADAEPVYGLLEKTIGETGTVTADDHIDAYDIYEQRYPFANDGGVFDELYNDGNNASDYINSIKAEIDAFAKIKNLVEDLKEKDDRIVDFSGVLAEANHQVETTLATIESFKNKANELALAAIGDLIEESAFDTQIETIQNWIDALEHHAEGADTHFGGTHSVNTAVNTEKNALVNALATFSTNHAATSAFKDPIAAVLEWANRNSTTDGVEALTSEIAEIQALVDAWEEAAKVAELDFDFLDLRSHGNTFGNKVNANFQHADLKKYLTAFVWTGGVPDAGSYKEKLNEFEAYVAAAKAKTAPVGDGFAAKETFVEEMHQWVVNMDANYDALLALDGRLAAFDAQYAAAPTKNGYYREDGATPTMFKTFWDTEKNHFEADCKAIQDAFAALSNENDDLGLAALQAALTKDEKHATYLVAWQQANYDNYQTLLAAINERLGEMESVENYKLAQGVYPEVAYKDIECESADNAGKKVYAGVLETQHNKIDGDGLQSTWPRDYLEQVQNAYYNAHAAKWDADRKLEEGAQAYADATDKTVAPYGYLVDNTGAKLIDVTVTDINYLNGAAAQADEEPVKVIFPALQKEIRDLFIKITDNEVANKTLHDNYHDAIETHLSNMMAAVIAYDDVEDEADFHSKYDADDKCADERDYEGYLTLTADFAGFDVKEQAAYDAIASKAFLEGDAATDAPQLKAHIDEYVELLWNHAATEQMQNYLDTVTADLQAKHDLAEALDDKCNEVITGLEYGCSCDEADHEANPCGWCDADVKAQYDAIRLALATKSGELDAEHVGDAAEVEDHPAGHSDAGCAKEHVAEFKTYKDNALTAIAKWYADFEAAQVAHQAKLDAAKKVVDEQVHTLDHLANLAEADLQNFDEAALAVANLWAKAQASMMTAKVPYLDLAGVEDFEGYVAALHTAYHTAVELANDLYENHHYTRLVEVGEQAAETKIEFDYKFWIQKNHDAKVALDTAAAVLASEMDSFKEELENATDIYQSAREEITKLLADFTASEGVVDVTGGVQYDYNQAVADIAADYLAGILDTTKDDHQEVLADVHEALAEAKAKLAEAKADFIAQHKAGEQLLSRLGDLEAQIFAIDVDNLDGHVYASDLEAIQKAMADLYYAPVADKPVEELAAYQKEVAAVLADIEAGKVTANAEAHADALIAIEDAIQKLRSQIDTAKDKLVKAGTLAAQYQVKLADVETLLKAINIDAVQGTVYDELPAGALEELDYETLEKTLKDLYAPVVDGGTTFAEEPAELAKFQEIAALVETYLEDGSIAEHVDELNDKFIELAEAIQTLQGNIKASQDLYAANKEAKAALTVALQSVAKEMADFGVEFENATNIYEKDREAIMAVLVGAQGDAENVTIGGVQGLYTAEVEDLDADFEKGLLAQNAEAHNEHIVELHENLETAKSLLAAAQKRVLSNYAIASEYVDIFRAMINEVTALATLNEASVYPEDYQEFMEDLVTDNTSILNRLQNEIKIANELAAEGGLDSADSQDYYNNPETGVIAMFKKDIEEQAKAIKEAQKLFADNSAALLTINNHITAVETVLHTVKSATGCDECDKENDEAVKTLAGQLEALRAGVQAHFEGTANPFKQIAGHDEAEAEEEDNYDLYEWEAQYHQVLEGIETEIAELKNKIAEDTDKIKTSHRWAENILDKLPSLEIDLSMVNNIKGVENFQSVYDDIAEQIAQFVKDVKAADSHAGGHSVYEDRGEYLGTIADIQAQIENLKEKIAANEAAKALADATWNENFELLFNESDSYLKKYDKEAYANDGSDFKEKLTNELDWYFGANGVKSIKERIQDLINNAYRDGKLAEDYSVDGLGQEILPEYAEKIAKIIADVKVLRNDAAKAQADYHMAALNAALDAAAAELFSDENMNDPFVDFVRVEASAELKDLSVAAADLEAEIKALYDAAELESALNYVNVNGFRLGIHQQHTEIQAELAALLAKYRQLYADAHHITNGKTIYSDQEYFTVGFFRTANDGVKEQAEEMFDYIAPESNLISIKDELSYKMEDDFGWYWWLSYLAEQGIVKPTVDALSVGEKQNELAFTLHDRTITSTDLLSQTVVRTLAAGDADIIFAPGALSFDIYNSVKNQHEVTMTINVKAPEVHEADVAAYAVAEKVVVALNGPIDITYTIGSLVATTDNGTEISFADAQFNAEKRTVEFEIPAGTTMIDFPEGFFTFRTGEDTIARSNALTVVVGNTTSIQGLIALGEKVQIFDLEGRRVKAESLISGQAYIINGEKQIVK